MRILCLHDIDSSATLMLDQLHHFAEKLHFDHGIELAFVNSPLVNVCTAAKDDATCHDDASTSSADSADNADFAKNNNEMKRTWFHEKNVGLDASILSLSQIWKQSLYSNPFCGVMGIGQGAALAGLLPLLRAEDPLLDNEKDGHDSGHGNEDNERTMFDGVKFCIFINGYDLLRKDVVDAEDDTTTQSDNGYYYHEAKAIPSLHIVSSPTSASTSTSTNYNKSQELFEHYGGGGKQQGRKTAFSIAQIHHHDIIKDKKMFGMSIFNLIGKFLIKQKKALSPKKKNNNKEKKEPKTEDGKKNTVIGVTSNDDDDFDENILSMIEKTRNELALIEKEAQSLVATTIAADPPKSLMAVITPDLSNNNSTLVGGWAGEKDAFRSEGFRKSGGAPCPKEFILKQENRLK